MMVICKYCKREFSSQKALSSHIGKIHKLELQNSPVHIQSRYTDDYLDITYNELNEKRSIHSGKCDICGKTESANTRPDSKLIPNRLCIDHDHKSKKFRGFLCVQCNRNFGWYDKYKSKILEHENFKHV